MIKVQITISEEMPGVVGIGIAVKNENETPIEAALRELIKGLVERVAERQNEPDPKNN